MPVRFILSYWKTLSQNRFVTLPNTGPILVILSLILYSTCTQSQNHAYAEQNNHSYSHISFNTHRISLLPVQTIVGCSRQWPLASSVHRRVAKID